MWAGVQEKCSVRTRACSNSCRKVSVPVQDLPFHSQWVEQVFACNAISTLTHIKDCSANLDLTAESFLWLDLCILSVLFTLLLLPHALSLFPSLSSLLHYRVYEGMKLLQSSKAYWLLAFSDYDRSFCIFFPLSACLFIKNVPAKFAEVGVFLI